MTYDSTFDDDPYKLRKKCPNMLKRIMDRVDDICKNPRVGTRMVNSPLYRDKVGNYRIKYSVDEGARRVDFTEIGPRDGSYKAG